MLVLLLATGLVACSESAPTTTNAPPEPVNTDAGTLLPVITDNTTPDTTLPPNAMFGGDVCSALTASDIESTSYRGVGTGALTATNSPSPDSCQYTVGSATTATVLVQMISPADFAAPPASNELVEPLTGVGIAARTINHGATVEVQVQVDNGWFSVTTPDQASAQRLAARAAPRATAAPVVTTSTGTP